MKQMVIESIESVEIALQRCQELRPQSMGARRKARPKEERRLPRQTSRGCDLDNFGRARIVASQPPDRCAATAEGTADSRDAIINCRTGSGPAKAMMVATAAAATAATTKAPYTHKAADVAARPAAPPSSRLMMLLVAGLLVEPGGEREQRERRVETTRRLGQRAAREGLRAVSVVGHSATLDVGGASSTTVRAARLAAVPRVVAHEDVHVVPEPAGATLASQHCSRATGFPFPERVAVAALVAHGVARVQVC
mmetsp:Transcript_53119/g.153271  ORF Transcript_53119/g.153271 Transcript_53119/m.153271 type:complete len:253 (-) Transcript_53119:31-789(-)